MHRRRLLLFGAALSLAGLAGAAVSAGAADWLLGRHDHRNHVHKDEARDPAVAAAAAEAVPDERLSGVACDKGRAGPFACDGVDLLSFVPATEFAGPETDPLSDDFGPTGVGGISDIWGWTDSEAGDDGVHDEYVILGKTNGVGFFRVTNPLEPEYLGELPNTAAAQLVWHDIKVHADHAFIVSESAPHGMQVFDLRQLRDVTGDDPRVFPPTSHYPLNVSAHNVAINEETGFAYLLGSNIGILAQEPCSLHIVDISDPATPTPAGCWAGERGQLGSFRPVEYVHDAQCTVYRGPDADHQGKEICFASDEINLSIVDVTDKSNPVLLGQIEYTDVAYAHQGWLTDDHQYFFLGDELDEQDFGLPTRTVVFDVRDLDRPAVHFEHLHETAAIDHNMYVDGPLMYQSNYTAGLRVLDVTGVGAKVLNEIAWFDTFPADDDDPITDFFGTWSNYPYFESGTIAVSGMDEGLFLVRVQDHAKKKIGKHGSAGKRPESVGKPDRIGDPAVQRAVFAIGCVPGDDGTTCASTSRQLSAAPGESTVGTLGSLTPLNEAIFVLDGSEPTQQYPADDTLAPQYRLRAGEIAGQITLRSFADAGVGLTTVYVEVTGRDAAGQVVKVGNATVTQPMLPGGETVFEFTIEVDEALDGVVIERLSAGLAVRGANLLAGYTDGQGGSWLDLPHYTS